MTNDADAPGVEKFPRVMFAAPQSGSGKTVITCGFLDILKHRGLNAASFKCGPDYIDPLFHSFITGAPGINLDSFFLGRGDIIRLFERKAKGSSLSVIEGVMGYYDGIAGTSLAASSFDIAGCLDCPVILILDLSGLDSPPEEVLKTLLCRVPESHIKGVILNRSTSEDAERLRPKFDALGIHLYGFVPECPEADIKSRHLGLAIPADGEDLREKISAFSDILCKTLDVDGMIRLAMEAVPLPEAGTEQRLFTYKSAVPKTHAGGRICDRIAVARDEAFCFIYEDNLDLLREWGYEIVPFSPLHDAGLPEDISALILCGGYPEAYAAELSANRSMLCAVRGAFGKIRILAECGGFLYLGETLEGMDGLTYPVTGCIKAQAFRTERSSRFGYISLYERSSSGKDASAAVSGADGPLIKAHEFHYWDSTAPGSDLTAVKPFTGRTWDCIYMSPALLAGFPHLYYRSGPEFILSFLEG